VDSLALTNAQGIAHLQAAPYGDFALHLAADARGYLPEGQSISVKEVEAIEPAHLFEATDKRPVCFVLALYAGPTPTVELVLPPLYHGPVKAEVLIREDAPCPPGQRCFCRDVPPTGVVGVTGPVLLRRLTSLDYRLKYADGTALTRNACESDVGFWWLKQEGGDQYFFVGTAKEYASAHPESIVKESQHSNGGRGSGGGRGHRN
jgi:hypothetical protein